jgi:hypothetical protein
VVLVQGVGPTLSACMRLALQIGPAMWSVPGDRLLVSTNNWLVQRQYRNSAPVQLMLVLPVAASKACVLWWG